MANLFVSFFLNDSDSPPTKALKCVITGTIFVKVRIFVRLLSHHGQLGTAVVYFVTLLMTFHRNFSSDG